MPVLPIVIASLMGANPVQFQRHLIDNFPAGYQVAVADINGDGRPDVIALSTEADRVDWYENPGWQRHPVARTAKNIDLAVRDLDHDGRPLIALASGFYFNESARGGEIQILRQPAKAQRSVAAGADRCGPGGPSTALGRSGGQRAAGAHPRPDLRFRLPGRDGPEAGTPLGVSSAPPPRAAVGVWKIDESLTVLHGIQVADLDGDGRDEILTASFEGIHRFDFKGQPRTMAEGPTREGAPPVNNKPGTPAAAAKWRPFIYPRVR